MCRGVAWKNLTGNSLLNPTPVELPYEDEVYLDEEVKPGGTRRKLLPGRAIKPLGPPPDGG